MKKVQGIITIDELRQKVQANEIDTVIACFPDMQGRLTGKRFHAEYFCQTAYAETHACNYLLAVDVDMEPVPGYEHASWEKGYGDFTLKPILSSIRIATWLPATALVLCDLSDHHNHPIEISPRAILSKQCANVITLGYDVMAASELEFFLFEQNYKQCSQNKYQDLSPLAGPYTEDYSIFLTSKEEEVMRAIRNHLHRSGVPVENSKGEWSPGQEEINIQYCEVLEMADRHTIVKNAIKEIALMYDRSVTFMAKYHYSRAGSSSHMHISLRDSSGKNAFYDPSKPHGMSDLMCKFLAGMLEYVREVTWFLAPYINSYKRFSAGTFAPTKAVWSIDNRTSGFRICGANTSSVRIECRIPGADVNPYLAYAMLVAAGLKGVKEQLPLGKEFSGNAYNTADISEIPTSLADAITLMKKSSFIPEVIGTFAHNHYIHTAEWELFEMNRRVTDWELWRGFERY
ncbi:MAG: glutamine synthetase family protein [Methylacidiphilales bacterium]|nr:glutamine synthetase family protein [Candidatus Methylacidiphilales bacterium]